MISTSPTDQIPGRGPRRFRENEECATITKKRVLFMPVSMSTAHVGRLVKLAESLSPQAYDVSFALEERDHPLIPPIFKRRHATSLTPEECRRRLEQGQPLIDAPLLRKQVKEDLALLRDIRPDLVVGDFRPSLAMSGPLTGIPYMNVVNAHWSPWSKESFQVAAPPDIPFFKYLGFRLGKKISDAFLPVGFVWHSRPFNQVRREYGLPILPHSLRGIYAAGDYVAYADLPEMAPTPGAPAQHRHIGPVLWEPRIPLPDWWDELPKDKPLVYVSAGSTGRTNYFPPLLQALAELPVAVVVSTAGREYVRSVPGRVFVADFVPGLRLCQRARLVVNNGGAGGVYQALRSGVPVLGIAANMDQCMVMKPISRLGAGQLVLAGETQGYPWGQVIRELMGSTTACNAAKSLSRKLRSWSAESIFSHWVNQILQTPSSSPPATNRDPFAQEQGKK